MNKKAFTLAEIMIVLTIIGVLTAILLPIANHSRPDENVMKFKKADTTLKNAIRELVNSDKYYLDGDLSKMPDGNYVTSAKYFCESLADILTTKSVNCMDINTGANILSHYNLNYATVDPNRAIDDDSKCTLAVQHGMKAEITTTDGVEFYQTNPAYHFGAKWVGGNTDDTVSADTGDIRLFVSTVGSSLSDYGFMIVYKPFCIDVDGIGKGEDPFAYGIRYDGKIIMSKRGADWLEKGFQKGANDN